MRHAKKVHWALIPFGWVFGTTARLRRWLYARRILPSYTPEIPVICVGNLAVGGTGKTPHAIHIVKELSQTFQVAMLSRGYGRKTRGYVLANDIADEQLSAALIGDEPLLLHRRFPSLPLAVDGNRREGVLRLRQYAPETEVVVMDDAYQHLSFSPTLKMVLTEFAFPYFQDYPLPAGRLREFPAAVSEADLVIVTKTDVTERDIVREVWRKKLQLRNDQGLFFTRYAYANPEPVTAAAQRRKLESIHDIVLLTGIARPQTLVAHLSESYTIRKHFNFPDHHTYHTFELENIIEKFFPNDTSTVLFTTEKDWMRMQNRTIKKIVSLLPVFIIPVQVEFLSDDERILFNQTIYNHVGRRKEKH